MSNNLFSPLINSLCQVPKSLYNILYQLPKYASYELPPKETRIGDMSFPIGVTKTDKMYLNIGQRNVHTLITGASGYGKSNLLNSIICSITQLYPNTQLLLLDFKAVELAPYNSMSNVITYQYQGDKITNTLEQLYQSILSKYEQMLSNNKRCVSVYDTRTVVIIDEVSLCNRKKDIPLLEKCMAISRACGVHFILALQRADSIVLSPIIRNLLDNIVTFKLDLNTSNLVLSNDNASLLDTVGKGIFKLSDKSIEFQSYHVTDNVIDTVVKANTSTVNINPKAKDININPKAKDNTPIVKREFNIPTVNTIVNEENASWIDRL